MNITIRRKPIFDAVRAILERGFTRAEVDRIDRAIDQALKAAEVEPALDRIGALSEAYESGGRGPGAVSSGRNDPGGASYGIFQLAARTGTVGTFLQTEGAPWARELAVGPPGSAAFSRAWQDIAQRQSAAFEAAQYAFIERTHYRPAVRIVLERTGLDLDARHRAVRDVTWSVAVQHGGAASILAAAVERTDARLSRDSADYDKALVEAIYGERTRYVLRVAERSGAGARRTLRSITRNRYPAELADALAMFES